MVFTTRCCLCNVHNLFSSLLCSSVGAGSSSFLFYFFPPVSWNWNKLIGDLGIQVCLFETLSQLKWGLFLQMPMDAHSCGWALLLSVWNVDLKGRRVRWEVSSEGRKSIQSHVSWIMNKALSPEVRRVLLDRKRRCVWWDWVTFVFCIFCLS